MRAFPDGVHQDKNEAEYQAALKEYRDGLVVNLRSHRNGRHTLHRAGCGTVDYQLASKGQTSRSPKYLFRGVRELLERGPTVGIDVASLNDCGRCKPRARIG